MEYNSNTNIDNDTCYGLLLDFARTKIPSPELCLIVNKLIHNKIHNNKYRNVLREDKEDMATQAMIDFILYGHNFKPKPTYSKGVAVGYLNFNMNNTFNRFLKKLSKQQNEVNIEVDIAYWDTSFDEERDEHEEGEDNEG